MAKQLQDSVTELRKIEGELLEVNKKVSPATYEVTAVLRKLEEKGLFPTVMFNNCTALGGDKASMRVLSNLFATRQRCAMALGLPPDDSDFPLSLEYSRLVCQRTEPTIVSRDKAPVKEMIRIESDVDLSELPIVRHHEMDPAPYIDMVTCHRSKASGVYNTAFQRTMYKGPRRLALFMGQRHNWEMCREFERDGLPAPVIIIAGHHPAFYLGSLNLQPWGVDDYQVIGSVMNEPLRLVESETWGDHFLVPADAEIIIEGEMKPNVREAEGPFGEWTGYYGPQRLSWIIDVTAITHRSNAILQDIFVSHRENWLLGAIPKEGDIFNAVKGYVPTVKAVHIPVSGNGRLYCYISIDKQRDGEPRHAALITLSVCDFVKYVVVVDQDVNPFNEGEVLWAMGTRCQPDKDIDIIRDTKCTPLDPSIVEENMGAKMIVDATVPLNRAYAVRVKVPDEILNKVALTDYFEEEKLSGCRRFTDSLRSV